MRTKTTTRHHAIVTAAADVFLERGFDRTTMSDIADRVGYSKATVYSYFPSKDELFLACMRFLGEAHFGSAFRRLATSGDLRETLRSFGRALLRVMTSDTAVALHRLMVVGSAEPGVGARMFAEGPEKAESIVVELLESAMQAGQLRRCDPRVAAAHLRGLLESEMHSRRLFGVLPQPSGRQIGTAVDRAVAVFVAAYGPAGPALRGDG